MHFERFEKIVKMETREESHEFELRRENLKKLLDELKKMVAEGGGPEEFFSVSQYELENEFEEIIFKLSDLASKAIKESDFSEVIGIGKQTLEALGISVARNVSQQSPDGAIAIAEAINWGAKAISYSLYSLKPLMIVAAAQTEGVFFGCSDDGAYYIGSPTIGVASFHDPNDEVGYIITHSLQKSIPKWEHEWSGVPRQYDAFNLLEDLNSRKGLIETYANATSPQEIRDARDKYMKNNFHDRLVNIGNLLR